MRGILLINFTNCDPLICSLLFAAVRSIVVTRMIGPLIRRSFGHQNELDNSRRQKGLCLKIKTLIKAVLYISVPVITFLRQCKCEKHHSVLRADYLLVNLIILKGYRLKSNLKVITNQQSLGEFLKVYGHRRLATLIYWTES